MPSRAFGRAAATGAAHVTRCLGRRCVGLLLALALGGCTGDGGTHGLKKVFSMVRGSAHKSLDPVRQFDSASAEIVGNVYDTLLQYSYLERPYALEPDLVTKMPELSADGLGYEFELRDDVRFVDDPCFAGGKGRPLVVDDVIYSLKRYADANLNIKSYALLQGVIEGMDAFHEQSKQRGKATDYAKLSISGVVKHDDRHFSLKLTRKNPLALFPLAATQLSIVPHEAVSYYGRDFENHPVGSGPFVIKRYARRGVMILRKNPHYHQTYPSKGAPGDAEAGLLRDAGKRLPLIDELQLPLIEESQPAMLKFLTGQLDWVAIDRDNFVKMAYHDERGFHLRQDYAKKFTIYSEPYLAIEYFSINLKDPLLGKNKALRQAMAYALDIPGFIARMKNGRGEPLYSIVPPPIAGSVHEVASPWYEHNLELAKKKLAEAGFPGGQGLPPITVEYRHTSGLVRQDFEYHRAQLAEAGITLKGNFQTFTAFLEKVEVTGNFQMAEGGWQADYPDAENFYQLLYGPNKVPGPNATSYANPEYDKLYEQSRFMPNGPERFAIFARLNEIMRQDVPLILEWTPTAVGMNQRWVHNFKRNMMIDIAAKYFDVDAAKKREGVH
jgi:ABC-type transport system substrate-binding protein